MPVVAPSVATPESPSRTRKNKDRSHHEGSMPQKSRSSSASSGAINSKMLKNPPSRARVSEAIALVRRRQGTHGPDASASKLSQNGASSTPNSTAPLTDQMIGKAHKQNEATSKGAKSLFRSALGRPATISRSAQAKKGTRSIANPSMPRKTNGTISSGEAAELVKSARKTREVTKSAREVKETGPSAKQVVSSKSIDRISPEEAAEVVMSARKTREIAKSARTTESGSKASAAGSAANPGVSPRMNSKISAGEVAELVKSARRAREVAKSSRKAKGVTGSMREVMAVSVRAPLSTMPETQSPMKNTARSPPATPPTQKVASPTTSPRGSDGKRVATATSPTKRMSPHGTFLLNIFASRASDPGTLAMPTLTGKIPENLSETSSPPVSPRRDGSSRTPRASSSAYDARSSSSSVSPPRLPRTPSSRPIQGRETDLLRAQYSRTHSLFGSSTSVDSSDDGSVDPRTLADVSKFIDAINLKKEEDQMNMQAIDDGSVASLSLAATATLDDALVADVGRFIDKLNQRMGDALERDDSVDESDTGTSLPGSQVDQTVLAEVGRFIDFVNKRKSDATEPQGSFDGTDVASTVPASSAVSPAVLADVGRFIDALNQNKFQSRKDSDSVRNSNAEALQLARSEVGIDGELDTVQKQEDAREQKGSFDSTDVASTVPASSAVGPAVLADVGRFIDALNQNKSQTRKDSDSFRDSNAEALQLARSEVDSSTAVGIDGELDTVKKQEDVSETEVEANITFASVSTDSFDASVEPGMLADIGRVIDSVAVSTKVVHIQDEDDNEIFSDSSDEESIPEETMAGIGAFIDSLQQKVQPAKTHDAPSYGGHKMYMSSSEDTSEYEFAAVVPETEDQISAFISSMEKIPHDEEQQTAALESTSEKENDPPSYKGDMDDSQPDASDQVDATGVESTASPNRIAPRAIDSAMSKDSFIFQQVSQDSCGEERPGNGSPGGDIDQPCSGGEESTKGSHEATKYDNIANESVVANMASSPLDSQVVVEEIHKLNGKSSRETEDKTEERSHTFSYSTGVHESNSHGSLTSSPDQSNLAGEGILRASRTSDTFLSNETDENTLVRKAEDMGCSSAPDSSIVALFDQNESILSKDVPSTKDDLENQVSSRTSDTSLVNETDENTLARKAEDLESSSAPHSFIVASIDQNESIISKDAPSSTKDDLENQVSEEARLESAISSIIAEARAHSVAHRKPTLGNVLDATGMSKDYGSENTQRDSTGCSVKGKVSGDQIAQAAPAKKARAAQDKKAVNEPAPSGSGAVVDVNEESFAARDIRSSISGDAQLNSHLSGEKEASALDSLSLQDGIDHVDVGAVAAQVMKNEVIATVLPTRYASESSFDTGKSAEEKLQREQVGDKLENATEKHSSAGSYEEVRSGLDNTQVSNQKTMALDKPVAAVEGPSTVSGDHTVVVMEEGLTALEKSTLPQPAFKTEVGGCVERGTSERKSFDESGKSRDEAGSCEKGMVSFGAEGTQEEKQPGHSSTNIVYNIGIRRCDEESFPHFLPDKDVAAVDGRSCKEQTTEQSPEFHRKSADESEAMPAHLESKEILITVHDRCYSDRDGEESDGILVGKDKHMEHVNATDDVASALLDGEQTASSAPEDCLAREYPPVHEKLDASAAVECNTGDLAESSSKEKEETGALVEDRMEQGDLYLQLTESSMESLHETEDVSAYFARKLVESKEDEELQPSNSLDASVEKSTQNEVASISFDANVHQGASNTHISMAEIENGKSLRKKPSLLDEEEGLGAFKLMGVMEIDSTSSDELEKALNSSLMSSKEPEESVQHSNAYDDKFGDETEDMLNIDLKASDLIDVLLNGTQEEDEIYALGEGLVLAAAREDDSQEIGQLDFILDFVSTKADDLWEGRNPSEEEIEDFRRSAQRMGVKSEIVEEIIGQKQEEQEEEALRIKMAVSTMKSIDESDNIDSFFTRMTTRPEGASVEEISKLNHYSKKVAALCEGSANENECADLIGAAKRDGLPAYFINNMYGELFHSSPITTVSQTANPRVSANVDADRMNPITETIDDEFFAGFAPAEGAAQSEVEVLNFITKKVDALWKGDKRPSESEKDELRRAAKVMGVAADVVEEMIQNACSGEKDVGTCDALEENNDDKDEEELCLKMNVSSMESFDENDNIESFLTKMTRDPEGASEDEISKLNYYAKKVAAMCESSNASEEERTDLIGEVKRDGLPAEFINIIYDELFKNSSAVGSKLDESECFDTDGVASDRAARNTTDNDFFAQFAPAVGVAQSEVDGLNSIAKKAHSLWEGGRRPSQKEIDKLRRSAADMSVPTEFVEELISRHSIVLTAVLRSTNQGSFGGCESEDDTDNEEELCLKMTVSSMKSIDENDNIESFLTKMTTGPEGVSENEIPKLNFYSKKIAALSEHSDPSADARTDLIRDAKRDGLPADFISMMYTELFERSSFEDKRPGDSEMEKSETEESDCVDVDNPDMEKLTLKTADSAFIAQFAPAVGAAQSEVDALNFIAEHAHALWEHGRRPSQKKIDGLRHASADMGVPADFVEDLISRHSIVLSSVISRVKEHDGGDFEVDREEGEHIEEQGEEKREGSQGELEKIVTHVAEDDKSKEDDEDELLLKMTVSSMKSIDEDDNIESFLTKKTTGPEGASEEEILKLNYYSKKFADMLDGGNKSEEECADLLRDARRDGLPVEFINTVSAELFRDSFNPGVAKTRILSDESDCIGEDANEEKLATDSGSFVRSVASTGGSLQIEPEVLNIITKMAEEPSQDDKMPSKEKPAELLLVSPPSGMTDIVLQEADELLLTSPTSGMTDMVLRETIDAMSAFNTYSADKEERAQDNSEKNIPFGSSSPIAEASDNEADLLGITTQKVHETRAGDKTPPTEEPEELLASPSSSVLDAVLKDESIDSDEHILASPTSGMTDTVLRETIDAMSAINTNSTDKEEGQQNNSEKSIPFGSSSLTAEASDTEADLLGITTQKVHETRAGDESPPTEEPEELLASSSSSILDAVLKDEPVDSDEHILASPTSGMTDTVLRETIVAMSAINTNSTDKEEGQQDKSEKCTPFGSSSPTADASDTEADLLGITMQKVHETPRAGDETPPTEEPGELLALPSSNVADAALKAESVDAVGDIDEHDEAKPAESDCPVASNPSLEASQTEPDASESLASQRSSEADEVLKDECIDTKDVDQAQLETVTAKSNISVESTPAVEASRTESDASKVLSSPRSSVANAVDNDEFANSDNANQAQLEMEVAQSNFSVESAPQTEPSQTDPDALEIIKGMVDALWEGDKVPSKEELDELLRFSRSAGVADDVLKEMVKRICQPDLKTSSSSVSEDSSVDSSTAMAHDRYMRVEEIIINEEIEDFLNRMARLKAEEHLSEAIIETIGSLGKSKSQEEAIEVGAAVLGFKSSSVDVVGDEKPWWQDEDKDECTAESKRRDEARLSCSGLDSKSRNVPAMKIDTSWSSTEEDDSRRSVRHPESAKQTIASPTGNSISRGVRTVPNSPVVPRSPMPPRSPMVPRSPASTTLSKKGSPLSIFGDIERMFEKRESYYTTQNLARWTSPWAKSGIKISSTRSKSGGSQSIGGVSAARAMARWSPRITKRRCMPNNRIWKQSYEERTKAHPGYFDVDVFSVYSTSVAIELQHPLDSVPWENRDVKQRFLYEKSISFSRNWFGVLCRKRGNDRVREPVAHPRSMVMPIENVVEKSDWNEEWYTTWQSRKDLGDEDDSYDSESSSFDDSFSDDEYTYEESSNEGEGSDEEYSEYTEDVEAPECGTFRNVRLKIGERVSRVHPNHTSSLRRSRWRKKYFPRGTFPY